MTRKIYVLFGLISLSIGFIGIFVPVLPTTPFAILAAFCFERGSPRLHAWLLRKKGLGPAILDWEKHKVIRPRAKFLAISLLILSVGYSVSYKITNPFLGALAGIVAIACAAYIITRKSRH